MAKLVYYIISVDNTKNDIIDIVNNKKILYLLLYFIVGAKGDWNFQISDLVKNPDRTDI